MYYYEVIFDELMGEKIPKKSQNLTPRFLQLLHNLQHWNQTIISNVF